MKIILILPLLVATLLTSCVKHYTHKVDYEVVATYKDGSLDTLSGTYTLPHSEQPSSPITIGLTRGFGGEPCITIRYAFVNLQKVACDVRKFKSLKQDITTTQE